MSAPESPAEWWPPPELVDVLTAQAAALAGNRLEAEDVLADALVALWCKRALVAKARNTEAYARQVLTRTFLNNRAATARRRRLQLRLARTATLVASPAPADAVDQVESVRAMLAVLPTNERTAIVLRYYLDLSDLDIAASIGCSEDSVRSYLSRGRARLRSHLVSS
ncbi:sigma-70 family RNA polymerase sigma factor [Nakamurella alba]|nr:sigma-70 family RNA polymerase sigma factor [Nakamurella alba]